MSNLSPSGVPIEIRPEAESDFELIKTLLDRSFNACYESELVARIRSTPHYLRELTLVAECYGQLSGFIMLSQVYLKGSTDSTALLSLAPVAVLPEFQKQGIGNALIRAVIALAETRKEPLIVLLGHESYYPRFGFETASKYGIFPPVDWPDSSYMIYRLHNWSPELSGKVSYPAAWQID
ncbi:MAG: N-acetyltransferase [Candidatus Obscuribacterales bacterium]|nr:N-acetyltransferase [Candidatus Obscuribacterales bacterium]